MHLGEMKILFDTSGFSSAKKMSVVKNNVVLFKKLLDLILGIFKFLQIEMHIFLV